MKLTPRTYAMLVLIGLALITTSGAITCKEGCKSGFNRDRNICNEAYRSNNDVTKYRDCLERAKTTYDNCMSTCQ